MKDKRLCDLRISRVKGRYHLNMTKLLFLCLLYYYAKTEPYKNWLIVCLTECLNICPLLRERLHLLRWHFMTHDMISHVVFFSPNTVVWGVKRNFSIILLGGRCKLLQNAKLITWEIWSETDSFSETADIEIWKKLMNIVKMPPTSPSDLCTKVVSNIHENFCLGWVDLSPPSIWWRATEISCFSNMCSPPSSR